MKAGRPARRSSGSSSRKATAISAASGKAITLNPPGVSTGEKNSKDPLPEARSTLGQRQQVVGASIVGHGGDVADAALVPGREVDVDAHVGPAAVGANDEELV